jgi:uncharacterized protein (TIGR04255 family)
VADFTGRLSRAPLVYALCQIRFAPVLKMADYVPDIQEQLRSRYEGFEEEQLADVAVQPKGKAIALRNETRWRFEHADGRSGYLLYNASLTYHTTAYTDFEQFVPEVVTGFTTVAKTAGIPRMHRIGLRYVDLIADHAGGPLEDYIHPQLRGFGTELQGVTERISQYVLAGTTAVGQILFRVTKGVLDTALPPDLLPLVLKPARLPDPKQRSLFIDTDHFVESTESIPPIEHLEGFLRDLKKPIAHAFKRVLTEKAVKEWQ